MKAAFKIYFSYKLNRIYFKAKELKKKTFYSTGDVLAQ